jgi:hypothetical protein
MPMEYDRCLEGSACDFVSKDGRTAVEVQAAARGIRDLYVSLCGLALYTLDHPRIRRACLVTSVPRTSPERLEAEWNRIRRVLRPEVADRLALVASSGETVLVRPDEPDVRRIGESFLPNLQRNELAVVRRVPAGHKFFEILKVLLYRWLTKQGPITVGKLAEQSACSYPTAAQALRRLEREGVLARRSNRSVELSGFPKAAWGEMLALQKSVRPSFYYLDATGRPPHPDELLGWLRRLHPPRVAVSGVEAARHWHPDFDLNGTPRLDLVVHTPTGEPDLGFVRKMTSALVPAGNRENCVLAIHILRRAESFFEYERGNFVPWADPVETTLDLIEIGLPAQANDLLAHFRSEARFLR